MIRLVVFILLIAFAEDEFFEGRVTYSLRSIDLHGNLVYSPIQLFETYYSNTKKITKILSGDYKLIVGDYLLYVDTDQKSRAEVWASKAKIVDLGTEPKKDIYYSVDKTELTETILGFNCIHFKVKRKSPIEPDTTYIDLFVADEMRIPSSKIVQIIGNSSTDNLNGSIEGLPLKIIIRNSEGTIEQKAVEIKRGKLNASLSNYLRNLKVD